MERLVSGCGTIRSASVVANRLSVGVSAFTVEGYLKTGAGSRCGLAVARRSGLPQPAVFGAEYIAASLAAQ